MSEGKAVTYTYACPKCGNVVGLNLGEMTAQELARAVGVHQRADQGLPHKLEDPAVIERLAALVAAHTTGRTR